ncbi:MAG: alpha/beta fold hydrolase [Bacteroidales bacterium]|nr:alpha/beta fold hydrolase [Bacteroidales bacterium]
MRKTFFILLNLLFAANIIANNNQTLVLVHGAWYGNWAWYQTEHYMEQFGVNVISVNLPGHGIDNTDPGTVTLADYIETIHQAIDTIEGEVVLVGHSMGGIAISATAEAYPDKIDKLVYLAGFMVQDGSSMLDIALQDKKSLILPNITIDTVNMVVDINRDQVAEIFYNRHKNAPVVNLTKKLLTKEPLIPIVTPLSLTMNNYGSIPRYYISTKDDKAVTRKIQKQMISSLPCRKVYGIRADHCPFLTNNVSLMLVFRNILKDDLGLGDDVFSNDEFIGEDIEVIMPGVTL